MFLAPLSIPIGVVPISFTNLAIFITIYVLGMKKATVSYLIYLLIGITGLPVFSGFTGGVEKIAGPTGGFLIGFILMTIIAGVVIDRFYDNKLICIIGMTAATWVLYFIGMLWLSYSAAIPLPAAFAKAVLPFIVGDMIKMVIASIVGPVLNERLNKAGVAVER